MVPLLAKKIIWQNPAESGENSSAYKECTDRYPKLKKTLILTALEVLEVLEPLKSLAPQQQLHGVPIPIFQDNQFCEQLTFFSCIMYFICVTLLKFLHLKIREPSHGTTIRVNRNRMF